MNEKISVRISKEDKDFIKKYMKENNLEDLSDALRKIILEKKESSKSFLNKIWYIFKRFF